MIFSDFSRLYKIIKIILSNGLDEFIPNNKSTKKIKKFRRVLFWIRNTKKDLPKEVRLREALETLGPVWIKLGQMLSTRRDLLPLKIIEQLSLLQDNVSPFDGNTAIKIIEESLGGKICEFFFEFHKKPLASASIAQVHTATLIENNKDIVIKVIRPDIEGIIKSDLKLMHRIAKFIDRYYYDSKRLKPKDLVIEYEKQLLSELDLQQEAANGLQLRRNFEDNNMLYIPKIYPELSTKNILVMERIYGIQVSDRETLIKNKIDLKVLAENAVTVFFTQVFRDSFFHADMHPGNIFVSRETPQKPVWIALDFGIVGTLNKEDKRYLAENLLAFFNRDYRKVAELHVDSGWVPYDTDIVQFESSIRTVCEPIFQKKLSDISFGYVFLNLLNTARKYQMEVQPQLVLLQKTLLYIEGLGRQLYPDLDLWATAKPFLEKWISEQLGPKALFNTIKEQLPYWSEKFPDLPDLIYQNLNIKNDLKEQLQYNQKIQLESAKRRTFTQTLLGIGATFTLGSFIMVSTSEELSISSLIVGVIFFALSFLNSK